MFSKLHDRLGTAGFVVAIVALVAALAGTAFAAAGLTGKQKNEVTKIAKKYAGKPGAPGAKGDPGAAGAAGTAGTNGKDGTNGKSVVLTAEAEGTGNCAGRGGTKVEVEGSAGSAKFVCNGKEGSPWTDGGTLPSEETETGAWAFGPNESPPLVFNEGERIPVSFTIPLEEPLVAGEVHFINAAGKETTGIVEDEITEQLSVVEATPTKCLGTVTEPTAEPGHLCVYTAAVAFTGFPAGLGAASAVLGEVFDPSKLSGFDKGAAATGAQIAIKLLKKGAKGWGTWAVTAE